MLYSLYFNHQTLPPIKTIPVVATVAEKKDVPIYIREIGSVTPRASITIKTQINGQLMNVFYKEGQMVKKGDLLAQIDPRLYEAQLKQYQGELKRDEALLQNATMDLNRYTKLWQQNSISQQILATQHSLVKQYEGTVETDQGLIRATEVNLSYCKITSPVNGRIGLRLVDPGNFVQTSDTTGLAVVNQMTPITVIFIIPEDDVPKVVPYLQKKLKVFAYDRRQEQILATGSLLAMDNQVNPTTGTVKLRATFDNKNHHLFPSQFVNISLLLETLLQATTIPTAAIQHRAKEDYVFLIDRKTNIVHIRTITTGPVNDEDTVVTKGLTPGDEVVLEGADKLLDLSIVKIMTETT